MVEREQLKKIGAMNKKLIINSVRLDVTIEFNAKVVVHMMVYLAGTCDVRNKKRYKLDVMEMKFSTSICVEWPCCSVWKRRAEAQNECGRNGECLNDWV